MQRARNRRGAHGQHVDVVLICLMRSLWRTPKRCSSSTTNRPRSRNSTSCERIRCVPIDDIDFAFGQALRHFAISFSIAKAAEHFDAHRKGRESALECLEMLEREHRGGREHRDLLAVAQRFERGAHGDFGLAVAHVAAQQTVHGMRALHILLDLLDGASWSLVSVNSNASSNSRCQLLSGENRNPSAMRR